MQGNHLTKQTTKVISDLLKLINLCDYPESALSIVNTTATGTCTVLLPSDCNKFYIYTLYKNLLFLEKLWPAISTWCFT